MDGAADEGRGRRRRGGGGREGGAGLVCNSLESYVRMSQRWCCGGAGGVLSCVDSFFVLAICSSQTDATQVIRW